MIELYGGPEFLTDTATFVASKRYYVKATDEDNPREYILPLSMLKESSTSIALELWTVAVKSPNINIRSAPNEKDSSNIIGTYNKGARLTVLATDQAGRAKNNGYIQVYGQDHWVYYDLLVAVS